MSNTGWQHNLSVSYEKVGEVLEGKRQAAGSPREAYLQSFGNF
jgi:hypothetical protein